MTTCKAVRRRRTCRRRPNLDSVSAVRLSVIQVQNTENMMKYAMLIIKSYVAETSKRHGDPDRDPGTKSEGEDDSQQGAVAAPVPCKKSLGKTPNHLTLR